MITYRVSKGDAGWTIQRAGLDYGGYRSEMSARKAAIAVAKRAAQSGQDAEVLLIASDGTSRGIWPVDATWFAEVLTGSRHTPGDPRRVARCDRGNPSGKA